MEESEVYVPLNEETTSQTPALEVLSTLGYKILTNKQSLVLRGGASQVLLKKLVKEKLKEMNSYIYRGESYSFSDKSIEMALEELDEPIITGVGSTNYKIYEKLLYGISCEEFLSDGTKRSFQLHYIDWKEPKNNVYHVVSEFEVLRTDGKKMSRPDLVLFINGIPIAVIECKDAHVNVKQAISQMIRNQGKEFIPSLFKYNQLTLAMHKNDVRYATCGTPMKFWSVWKEEDASWIEERLIDIKKNRLLTIQDETLTALCSPDRLLDIIRYFILFDNNVKKVARYQQFFAIKAIYDSVREIKEDGSRESGVVWHTQGSGKSLTMVMLAQYLFQYLRQVHPKIVIVTDRVELDQQIHQTFQNSTAMNVKIRKANNGRHLVELLEQKTDIITTLVNKFKTVEKLELLIKDPNVFVLVDESHRTQYGELHTKMKRVLPQASYIGFSGTPLMKSEKSTMKKFGKLIHKYTVADAVQDGATLPLLYEGRMADQEVNKTMIDQKLELITRHLSDKQKEEVKKKWSRFERLASSVSRLDVIAMDINEHFTHHLKGTGFKAMLATASKREAIRYCELLKEIGDVSCAVVISRPDEREGYDEVDVETDDVVQRFWKQMLRDYGSAEVYEERVKSDFLHEDLDLLIVVEKLLTGFDAPRASVLYIDRPLKEHNLLQAMARVNRLYEGKDYGLIIDYRGLIQKIDEAMKVYSGAGLENYDQEDLDNAFFDVKSTIHELKSAYALLTDFFKSIRNKVDIESYEVYLSDDVLREEFYDLVSNFSKHLGTVLASEMAYGLLDEKSVQRYKEALKFYQKLRQNVRLRYSDTVDHSEYEKKLQNLIDTYIQATDMIVTTAPVDILNKESFQQQLDRFGGSKAAKADMIATRMKKSIAQKFDEKPAYYQSFSERIEKILHEYREKRLSETEYYTQMEEIRKQYQSGEDTKEYPSVIQHNKNAQAFYGVMEQQLQYKLQLDIEEDIMADFSLQILDIVLKHRYGGWGTNPEVHRKIEKDLIDLLFTIEDNYDVIFDKEREQLFMEAIKAVALRRHG